MYGYRSSRKKHIVHHLAAIHGENVSELYIYLLEKEFPAETDQEGHVRTSTTINIWGAGDYIGLSDIVEKTHIGRTFELHSSVVSTHC